MAVTGIKAKILTGVPPYDQEQTIKERASQVTAGSGPTAAMMLLAYYSARFGYRQLLSRTHEALAGLPQEPAGELRRGMHTLNDCLHGQEWGCTLPVFFHAGLEHYIAVRYGRGVVKEYSANVFGRGLGSVFEHSRELIDAGRPHVLVLDWHGSAGVFPHLYVVVVGWRCDGGRRHLIANPGWGPASQFITIDMDDKRVKPASAYSIESIGKAVETDGTGQRIGPAPDYRWDAAGTERRLMPAVRRHFSDHVEVWEPSAPARELIAGTEFTVCEWG
jgi:hypothetical protein